MSHFVSIKEKRSGWDVWIWVLWGVVLAGIVCVGLDPRGFRFGNEVALEDGGLTMGRFGRVHVEIAEGIDGGFTVVVEGRAGSPVAPVAGI